MPRRAASVLDWPAFLADFHSTRPGAVEGVISRLQSGGHTPYRWLARAVSKGNGVVLDIACGSGAMTRELVDSGRPVVGLDLSGAELAEAARRGEGRWLQADALRLPLADESVDAVISCMGFSVIRPVEVLVDEAVRVLRPGGVLAVIAPSVRPMSGADLRIAAVLYAALRMRPMPGRRATRGLAALFTDRGLTKVDSGRECYRYPVQNREDAQRFIESLYQPEQRQGRREAAVDLLAKRAAKYGTCHIPVPMRRLVAVK